MLAPAERAAAGQQCLDAVADALHYVMDDVNMSTFFHRRAHVCCVWYVCAQ